MHALVAYKKDISRNNYKPASHINCRNIVFTLNVACNIIFEEKLMSS